VSVCGRHKINSLLSLSLDVARAKSFRPHRTSLQITVFRRMLSIKNSIYLALLSGSSSPLRLLLPPDPVRQFVQTVIINNLIMVSP
jgi:hypothetical protein